MKPYCGVMIMADLILNVDWDITEAEAKQRKLNRLWEESKAKEELIRKEAERIKAQIESEKQKQIEINEARKEQLRIIEETEKKLSLINNGKATPDQLMTWGGKSSVEAQLTAQEKELKTLNEARIKSYDSEQKLTATLDEQNLKLSTQKDKTAEVGDQIVTNSKKATDSTKKTDNAFGKLAKRISGLAKRVLIFSVITKALRALRSAIGDRIRGDSALAKYLAEIKGNLYVIGETLYQTAKPVIEWILQKVSLLTQLIAVVLARVMQKNVNNMAKFAKQSQKASNEAKKTLASWDTLQQINSDSNSSSSNIQADFSQFDTASWTEDQLLKIEAIAAGALLALGCILAFSGVNIPLGLALIAAGAILLVREVIPNWDKMSDETKKTIQTILGIAGSALLVIGIILLCSGVIPLGIGAIVAGIAVLGIAAATLDWNKIWQGVKDIFAKIIGVFSGLGMVVLGVILCLTGAGIPIGLALICNGISQMYNGATYDWNILVEKVRTIKNEIFSIISDLWTGIKTGNKDMIVSVVNRVVDALNGLIDKANSMLQSLFNKSWAQSFFSWMGIDTSNFGIPHIPHVSYLASGAVIPGGKPFPAVLGDQPRGKTNIEAPEDLIRQIVREESNSNINVNFTGTMAQLVRLMNPEITREQNRSSIWTGGTV